MLLSTRKNCLQPPFSSIFSLPFRSVITRGKKGDVDARKGLSFKNFKLLPELVSVLENDL